MYRGHVSAQEEWFLNDDPRWLFSFLNICAVLGLDPGYIRLGLKRWQQQPPAELRRKNLRRRAIPARQPLKAAA